MTKKSIKVLSLVLLLVLMVGILSVSVLAAEGDVQVTIQMTRYCPSMSLAPKAGGESIDVGEPSDMLYTFNAAPGDYILTGYDTDGKTVTGTIGVTISADCENSFNIAAVRVSQGNSSTLEYGVDWELAVTSLKDENGADRTDVSTGRLSSDPKYATFLAYVGDTYTIEKRPTEKTSGNYSVYTSSPRQVYATSSDTTAMSLSFLDVTVPSKEYEVEYGNLTKYYVYTKATTEGEPVVNADGSVTYKFPAMSGAAYYKVSCKGGATYWGWDQGNAGKVNITADMLTKVQVKKGGETIEVGQKTVNRNLELNQYETGDVYLAVNPQNFIRMGTGEEYQLVNIRTWQAIENFINSKTAVPNFHYQVIDENGKPSTDVITIDENGMITAKGEGTAIVLVTYDSMINMACYDTGIGGGSGGGFTFFSAIWPENTGVLVVSVGDKSESGIDLGMTINEGKNNSPDSYGVIPKLAENDLDGELDVFYYTGDEGASYTFKPTAGTTVTVARPTIGENSASYSGFTGDGVSYGEDGTVTLTGLMHGTNIVKIEKDGKYEFQIIRAKKFSYEILNADGIAYAEGEKPAPGDTIQIRFKDVYHPANKLAGIYNMAAVVKYDDPSGGGELTSTGSQYNFAYVDKLLTYTIPEDYSATTLSFSGGSMRAMGFGSPYGAHRSVTYNGVDQNFTATMRLGYLGSLPDIEVPIDVAVVNAVVEKDYYKVGDTVTVDVVVKDADDFNTAGYSLVYGTDNMVIRNFSSADGFAAATTNTNRETGSVSRVLYHENGAVSADGEGVVIDTLTFTMLEDGKPDISFATIEGDVDFSDRCVRVLSNGVDLSVAAEVTFAKDLTNLPAQVEALIDAIGEVTPDSAEAIQAARDAYDALTEEQQAMVKNYDTLLAAEAAYDIWLKGDVNRDGVINASDLSLLLGSYGVENADCDINMDGAVNAGDLSILLANYGAKIA